MGEILVGSRLQATILCTLPKYAARDWKAEDHPKYDVDKYLGNALCTDSQRKLIALARRGASNRDPLGPDGNVPKKRRTTGNNGEDLSTLATEP